MILQQKLSPATSFLWPRDSFGCDFSSSRNPPSLSIPFSFCYPLSDFYFFHVSWDVTLPSLTPKAQAAANFSLSLLLHFGFSSPSDFFFFPPKLGYHLSRSWAPWAFSRLSSSQNWLRLQWMDCPWTSWTPCLLFNWLPASRFSSDSPSLPSTELQHVHFTRLFIGIFSRDNGNRWRRRNAFSFLLIISRESSVFSWWVL